jgi:murein DD-endopeptidase MepM/ murein hydrolase activator NlpD
MRKPVPTIAETIEANSKALKNGAILVRRGDSLYSLARRHGIPLRGLIDANKLAPPYIIYPGQTLKPPVSHYHVVQKGETMYQISRHYDVDMGALVRVNKVEPPYWVTPGQRLRLPDPAHTKTADNRNSTVSERYGDRSRPEPRLVAARGRSLPTIGRPPASSKETTWSKPDPAPIKSPPPRTGRKFLWPLRGKVIVSFGARAGGLHNDGINIAARKGASIRAAESGVVAYTGNQLQGFGNLVLLKHAGGWMSAYAHSSLILVKRGDIVRRGQVIARVGRTGNVSTPQLHFELRRGERAVNPAYHMVRIAGLAPTGPRQYAALPRGLP